MKIIYKIIVIFIMITSLSLAAEIIFKTNNLKLYAPAYLEYSDGTPYGAFTYTLDGKLNYRKKFDEKLRTDIKKGEIAFATIQPTDPKEIMEGTNYIVTLNYNFLSTGQKQTLYLGYNEYGKLCVSGEALEVNGLHYMTVSEEELIDSIFFEKITIAILKKDVDTIAQMASSLFAKAIGPLDKSGPWQINKWIEIYDY